MNNEFETRFVRRVKDALLNRHRTELEVCDFKSAAVLVPIVFRDEEPHLILTRRTMTVAQHKGQISFPGGACEPEDATIENTALRETKEEIGVSADAVNILGRLDDFSTISGFLVTPVVGIVSGNTRFHTDNDEVAELFETPLAAFQNPDIHELITVDHDGTMHEYHSFEIGSRIVWGATAGIIHRLLNILELRGAS